MAVLKFLVLLGILLYASIKDLREHEVPDTVWKLIAVLGLVNISIRDLPSMILGAALVFLPQIIPAVQFQGVFFLQSVGDIKGHRLISAKMRPDLLLVYITNKALVCCADMQKHPPFVKTFR